MSSVSKKKIAAGVADTAAAVLLTGPAGGLGEAARQVITLAAGTEHQRTAGDILRRLRAWTDPATMEPSIACLAR